MDDIELAAAYRIRTLDFLFGILNSTSRDIFRQLDGLDEAQLRQALECCRCSQDSLRELELRLLAQLCLSPESTIQN